MRKVLKLTPETIKRLIKEERSKLELEDNKKLLESLLLLKKIKQRQFKSLKEAKQLHEMKKILINKIKRK